jgi:DNA-directed RNA polymerase subunit M/transcription elongation factor TFIIS
VYGMRSAFVSDPLAPTGSRFKCTACGCEQCTRVSVRKPSGSSYRTEFVSCAMCRVLYHWPGEVPRAPVIASGDDRQ